MATIRVKYLLNIPLRRGSKGPKRVPVTLRERLRDEQPEHRGEEMFMLVAGFCF